MKGLYVAASKAEEKIDDEGIEGGDQGGIEIPMELIEYVDHGGNPDEFMRHVMLNVLAKGQLRKGKLSALRALKEHVETQHDTTT